MSRTKIFKKIKSEWVFVLIATLMLFSQVEELRSNIITFDESRYVAVYNQRLYRGGPNTFIDQVEGLDFYVAYGEIFIDPYLVQSAPAIWDYKMWYSPKITATDPDQTDIIARIVITFNELKRYVKVSGNVDLWPSLTNPYARVSFYKNTTPSNLCQYQSIL